jgi:hypothetical protein
VYGNDRAKLEWRLAGKPVTISFISAEPALRFERSAIAAKIV